MTHRHADAGVLQARIAETLNLSESTVYRILRAGEPQDVDDRSFRKSKGVGRPSNIEHFADLVRQWFEEPRSPEDRPLGGSEVLRRLRKEEGFKGGKSAVFELVKRLRPIPNQPPVVRFEGLAGEFAQHDFGYRRVHYEGGEVEMVPFFASRLKFSRFLHVDLTPDERQESVFRALLRAFEKFGGMPSKSVFDQMRNVIGGFTTDPDGQLVPLWNLKFGQFVVECGFIPIACWPRRPNQKGSVENLVGFVKSGFFTGRRFRDRADLQAQLDEWLVEVNYERPCDATGEIPAARLERERERLQPCRFTPGRYAFKVSAVVRPTGRVAHDGLQYSVSSRYRGQAATLHVRADTVEVYIGHVLESTHPRIPENGRCSVLPQHAEEMFTYPRGKHYAKRQLLLDLSPIVEPFLTELVHRRPMTWERDVKQLYDLYREIGHSCFLESLAAAWEGGQIGAEYLVHHSRQIRLPGMPTGPVVTAKIPQEVSR
ncbi:MAG: transposase [Acidobacteria bacterium]|nr:transposase [Acidobacteriota bacterium]